MARRRRAHSARTPRKRAKKGVPAIVLGFKTDRLLLERALRACVGQKTCLASELLLRSLWEARLR
jgi:hypothetical protein